MFFAQLSNLQMRIAAGAPGIDLIASEMFPSDGVMGILGNPVYHATNKEGYPTRGGSFYSHYEGSDAIETLAIEQVTQALGCGFANVQPYSASIANLAVTHALGLRYGRKPRIFASDTAGGGHFTHGEGDHLTSALVENVGHILLTESLDVDYAKLKTMTQEKKPDVILFGGSSNIRQYDFEKLSGIAKSVGALLWFDSSHHLGHIIAGHYCKPFPHVDILTSSIHKSLAGPRTGIIAWNRSDLSDPINKAVHPGIQGEPNLANIAATAHAVFEARHAEHFKALSKNTYANAKHFAHALMQHGLFVVGQGTDTHVILINVDKLGLTGREASDALAKLKIYANQMPLPEDTAEGITDKERMSSVRLGTMIETLRGRTQTGFSELALVMADFLKALSHKKRERGMLDTESDLTEDFLEPFESRVEILLDRLV